MSHVHILEQACGILRTAKYQLVWRDFSGCLDSCVKGLEVLSSSVQADEAKRYDFKSNDHHLLRSLYMYTQRSNAAAKLIQL